MQRTSIQRTAWACLGLTVLLGLAACDQKPAKPKSQQTVKILPDTPPPPPKQEEKKPEPQKEEKPQQQLNQPKPVDAPPVQAQALKTNETPGDGPGSGLVAGEVRQDYKVGVPGTAASGGDSRVVDRARERLYANSARQMLREEIERRLRPEAGQLTAALAVWVAADGRIARYEVQPTGAPAADSDLRHALDDTSRALRLPPPDGVPQPMRFRLTVQPQG